MFNAGRGTREKIERRNMTGEGNNLKREAKIGVYVLFGPDYAQVSTHCFVCPIAEQEGAYVVYTG